MTDYCSLPDWPPEPLAARSCPVCEMIKPGNEFIASLELDGTPILSDKGVPELLCRSCNEARPEKVAIDAALAKRAERLRNMVAQMGKLTLPTAEEFVIQVVAKAGGMDRLATLYWNHLAEAPLGSRLAVNGFNNFAKLMAIVSQQQGPRIPVNKMSDEDLEDMVRDALDYVPVVPKLLEAPLSDQGAG